MLDVNIDFGDISVSRIEKVDLPQIEMCMELEKQFLGGIDNLDELSERFWESYISECEFFLKINKREKLIGILKGRMEFKNPNEVWIWFFYLNDNYKDTDLGSKIITELIKYFSEEYGTDIFFTRVAKNDSLNISFWKEVGFETVRMVKNFYRIDNEYVDMLIMKKILTSNKFNTI